MSNVDIHTFCGTRRSWWRQYADTVDEHDLEGVHVYIYACVHKCTSLVESNLFVHGLQPKL